MIKSMTGYGRQKGENERREVQVEIKSVNHRYLDLNVKVPRIYSFLEEPIKTAVSAAVARGKVDIYLSITAKEGGDAKVSPNLALAGEYLRALEQVRDTYSLKDDISVMELAHMPDLLTVAREEPDAEEVKTQVLEVLERALEEYNAMRRTEGERLCEDIARRGQEIGKMVDQVEQRSPQSVEEYRQKIAQRMTEILGDSDIAEQRILAEAALFADKVSVTEEVVRLRSHLSQLQKMVQGDAPVGRKLDFLVQELNREANTIGSKANDYELAQIVIEIKAEIEKIREQIQNLE
ncbi:YicC/YloC family endoribonuclease [Intestinimonas sp. MSJ-38]|uniref:YicC/YloC family endoribonuclease n=1 Tax=Intestinimonas sp. MSJ-38 TaxID=2841532 RepID=UPI001C0F6EB2|nr:YicC/YloC family endoribonuclease [Intestinimonas sp. MSJ-38]MBU5432104.1 YicC family protein [Intestinimonas sp. MSJ-38]